MTRAIGGRPEERRSSSGLVNEFGYLPDPEPLGGPGSAPAPDPKLYATYDGKQGEPSGPALGTEAGLPRKIKDAPHLTVWRKPAVTGDGDRTAWRCLPKGMTCRRSASSGT